MKDSQYCNVLFICVDQMRADTIHALGNPDILTPNLDALVNDSTSFQQCYSVSAPCCPARTSILSGQYPSTHGSKTRFDPFVTSTNLAKVISEHYCTPHLFGFTDTVIEPYLADREGIMPGFELHTYMNFHQKGLESWVSSLRRKGYQIPENHMDIYAAGQVEYSTAESDTAFLTDNILTFLDQQTETPWFIHASYLRPHPPFVVADSLRGLYTDLKCNDNHIPPDDFLQSHPANAWLFKRSHAELSSTTSNFPDKLAKKYQRSKPMYYALITELDQQLGRIFDQLKHSGVYDQTMIIFTSDHGEMLGDYWLYDKGGYFDQSYHVPLIWKMHQGFTQSSTDRTVDAFVESIDIMPTILESLSLPIPAECQGRSMLPLFETKLQHRDFVSYEYHIKNETDCPDCEIVTLKDHQFKYVYCSSLPDLLFDLTNDPRQHDNVFSSSQYQNVVNHYQTKLTTRL